MKRILSIIAIALIMSSLAHAQSEAPTLYVSSGTCYAGGSPTSPGAANVISKFDARTGSFLGTSADYNEFHGDYPASMADWDAERLLVAVESPSARRIELVRKDGRGTSAYIYDPALNNTLRGVALTANRELFVSKTIGVEKFSAARSRVAQPGGSPFVFAPAGACAIPNAFITSINASVSSKLIVTNAGSPPSNLIMTIGERGYTQPPDCLFGSVGPQSNSRATGAVIHKSGDLLVAFGPDQFSSIGSYRYNDVTGALSQFAVAWSDNGVVRGPSAIAADRESGDVYVASGDRMYETVERFRYDADARALRKTSAYPLIPSMIFTRCVTSLLVAQ